MDRRQVERAMAAMERNTGTRSGYRRGHARGVGFHATFTPDTRVAGLTTAEHLVAGGPVPTVVRLSHASGNPHAADNPPGKRGAVTGLAVRFTLPSGGHSTWAAASLPTFPARTGEDFTRFTEAQRPDGKPRPGRLLWYLLSRPYVLPRLGRLAGLTSPVSYATTRYNGLHAYHLVAADGTRRAFRYSWIPDAGEQPLTAQARQSTPRRYLIGEIERRLAAGPVGWRLVFQLAAPGDPTHDVTQQWPDDRETVEAGHLTLTAPHEDQEAVERMVFDPINVPPGIELSDDPLLRFRSHVYGMSYDRRTSEERAPLSAE